MRALQAAQSKNSAGVGRLRAPRVAHQSTEKPVSLAMPCSVSIWELPALTEDPFSAIAALEKRLESDPLPARVPDVLERRARFLVDRGGGAETDPGVSGSVKRIAHLTRLYVAILQL